MTAQDRTHIQNCLTYLSSGDQARHAAAVREEVVEAIIGHGPAPKLTRLLLKHGDPDLLGVHLTMHGHDILGQMKASAGTYIHCPLSALDVSHVRPEHLPRLVALIAPYIRSGRHMVEGFALRALQLRGTSELGDALVAHIPDPEALIRPILLELDPRANPQLRPWLARFLTSFAKPEDPAWQQLAEDALKRESAWLVAALLRLGVDFSRLTGPHHNPQNGQWRSRFAANLANNHDRLQMLAKLPSVEDILNLGSEEVRILTGGMSTRQRKRAEAQERSLERKENKARRLAMGLPLKGRP